MGSGVVVSVCVGIGVGIGVGLGVGIGVGVVVGIGAGVGVGVDVSIGVGVGVGAGVRVPDTLRKKRMDNARKLLRDTSLSVQQIALQCRYSCDNHFIKVFKKEFGETPAKFRANGQQFRRLLSLSTSTQKNKELKRQRFSPLYNKTEHFAFLLNALLFWACNSPRT